MVDSDTKKVPITISINKSAADFMKKLCVKVIEVNNERIEFKRNLSDTYGRAIEYALENVDEWA